MAVRPTICPHCKEYQFGGLVCTVCGKYLQPPEATHVTAFACGARVCPRTGQPHDMTAHLTFKDGGSVACKDCGATAMNMDLMELP